MAFSASGSQLIKGLQRTPASLAGPALISSSVCWMRRKHVWTLVANVNLWGCSISSLQLSMGFQFKSVMFTKKNTKETTRTRPPGGSRCAFLSVIPGIHIKGEEVSLFDTVNGKCIERTTFDAAPDSWQVLKRRVAKRSNQIHR